jgi:hypothetical protein
MKIPKQIRFMGYTYKVIVTHDHIFTDGFMSMTNHYDEEISIHSEVGENRKFQLMMNEMINMADHFLELDLQGKEEKIPRLSHPLSAIILNNRLHEGVIPKKIKHLSYTFDVKMDIEKTTIDAIFGEADFIRETVYIHSNASKTRMQEVLLHEAIHLVDFTSKTNLSEEQVVRLSHAVYSMLVNNGMMKRAD